MPDLFRAHPLVTHTIVSGGNIYHSTPIGNDFRFNFENLKKTNRIKAPIGTVFMSDLQTVFIKYADISETNNYPSIGQVIDEDINSLIKVGQLCFASINDNKEIIIAEISSENTIKKPFIVRPIFDKLPFTNDANLMQLASKMLISIEKIWLQPPEELKLIFSGKAKNKPGTNNQYFSAMFFVTSTLQSIAALGNATTIARVAQTKEFSLETLKKLLKHLLPLHVFDFLKYCGLDAYVKDAYKFLGLIESIKSIEIFFSLAAIFAIYTNQMHVWCLHYFPWSTGKNYTY